MEPVTASQRQLFDPTYLSRAAMSMYYFDLIRAGAALVNTDLFDNENASPHDISLFLTANRPHLRRARAALRKTCSVPLRDDLAFLDEQFAGYSHLRALAKALALELREEIRRGHLRRASRIAVDLLNLSNAVRRGGLILDWLISLAFAGMAMQPLAEQRPRFDEPTRKYLRRQLARTARESDPFPEIVVRDLRWEAVTGANADQPDLTAQLDSISGTTELTADEQIALEAVRLMTESSQAERNQLNSMLERRRMCKHRLLFVDLALRSYHAAAGIYPDSLAALTPAICRRLPRDPYSGRPFHYRRLSDHDFSLYGCGPAQTDHGGRAGSWLAIMSGHADFFLDYRDFESGCWASEEPQPD